MIHDFILLNTCIEADVVCAGIVSLIISLPIGVFFVLLTSWHCSQSCREIEVCQVLAWF